jgi:Tol biopolymer transport system component
MRPGNRTPSLARERPGPAAWRTGIGVLVGGLLLTADIAVAIRLSPPLVPGGFGFFVQITPDGARVVYEASQDTAELRELYGVAIDGGPVTKLSPPLGPGGDVFGSFQITPDGRRVVFMALPEAGGVTGLHSVEVEGGPVATLNPPFVPDGRLSGLFLVAPDSRRVVYLADQEADEIRELFSVPVEGGPAARLNRSLVRGGNVFDGSIAPDGRRVVYVADQETDGVRELYAVAIEGGPVTKLSGPLVAGGDVLDALITPDGRRVIYVADQDVDEVGELYSVPVTGGAVTKLSGPLVAGGDVEVGNSLQVAPDGSRVVYLADQDIDGVRELYSVPVAGGIVTKLNGPLVAGGDVESFQITPDGRRVVYRADQDTDGVVELHSARIDGGPATKLSGAESSGGVHWTFQLTPDGRRVVYVASPRSNQGLLHSVPVDGGPAARPSRRPSELDVQHLQITPDSRWLLYVDDTTGRDELHAVPVGGGPATKLNDPLPAGGYVSRSPVVISPDGRRALYWVRLRGSGVPGVEGLYAVPVPVFVDVPPQHALGPWIEALVDAGLTAGCRTDPPGYCPDRVVTRAQLAIFLVRGIHGPGAPPPATGTVFADVPVSAFGAAWIEELARLGITQGCATGPALYCPGASVTRGQAAVLLLRARLGAGYAPPGPTGTMFADVSVDHPFAAWIEQLAREGISAGCAASPARFCPEAPVTRGQMAPLLVRALDLPH